MPEQTDKKPLIPSFLSMAGLRDVLVILFLCVVGWKIVNADIKVDLGAFSFSDLLALVLALFSVSLSVAFYFKATDTSNRFYDNSYKFAKEMSEMLGRIEAGFGERLRHLDEGYAGIRDKFDRLPSYGPSESEEIKKEEEEVKKREREQRALLESLAKKAKLADVEKDRIFAQLSEKSEELDQARMELHQLRASRLPSRVDSGQRRRLIRYIAKRILKASPGIVDSDLPLSNVRAIFSKIKEDLDRDALRDLELLDMLDEEGALTRDAAMRIRIDMKRI